MAKEKILLSRNEIKAVGCLVGGAAGDALGFAVEFLEDANIFRYYGENGITEYRLADGVAQISDDTQMTLFTAEGLLSCDDGESLVDSVYRAYLDWLKTQNVKEPLSDKGLLAVPELYDRRAPGHTCISALESGECGRIDYLLNKSKGCGGIMRVSPVAIYCFNKEIPIARADMLGAQTSAITHTHPLGYIPSAMLVHILYRIFEGMDIRSAVLDAREAVPPMFEPSEELSLALDIYDRAVVLAETEDVDDLEALRLIGQGWVAEETLAVAVYCALKYKDDFDKALIASVNHSGDSDSTGAVTGNIVGAYLGAKGIPRKYLDRLELLETVIDLSRKLCEA